jgi:hypothetical protein
LRFQDLLDQRLDRAPFGVVGEIQLLPGVVQLPLHHLRGINIATIAAAVPASATTATATAKAATTAVAKAAAAIAAASVNLRESVAKAQSKGHGHRAHCYHVIQSHRMFFVVFGFVWFSRMHGPRH